MGRFERWTFPQIIYLSCQEQNARNFNLLCYFLFNKDISKNGYLSHYNYQNTTLK